MARSILQSMESSFRVTPWDPERVFSAVPASPAGSFRWYVVESKPQREFFAAHSMQRAGFTVHVPHFIVKQKKVISRRVAFPRYLLVSLSLAAGMWRYLPMVPGVRRLVTMDPERPISLPDDAVDFLMSHSPFEEAGAVSVTYEPGEWLHVTGGPFTGFSGTCVESDEDRQSVDLLITLFGSLRQVRFNVDVVAR